MASPRVASGRDAQLRGRVGVGVVEDGERVVGPSGEREALTYLAVLDDDAEAVAVGAPEERDGDPVALAVVKLLHRLGGGELGHPCLLLCLPWAGLHGTTLRPCGRGSRRRRPQALP